MFNTDKPIETNKDDHLKRTNFSKHLAKAILAYTKQDNFAISLCGKWGSGKTSIINMVIEEINKTIQGKNDDEKLIIIKFNPWNYVDSQQLIKQFFATIQDSLKYYKSNENLNKISDALENYSSLLEYTKMIPVIGGYLGPINKIIKRYSIKAKKKYQESNSIESQKNKIISALKEQNQKFLIIIDDIDRLTNLQIRDIFQLVNNLAGFPNMIYLLSFDREVVTRALGKVQNCNGNEYLEKIIQVTFNVPEASKQMIDNILIEKVDDLLRENNYNIEDYENRYCSMVLNDSVLPFINSVRDINRVLNSFEFKYSLMKDEIYPIDLLAITTLQVCMPDIYSWIEYNKDILVGSIQEKKIPTEDERKQKRDNYLKGFESISKNPELIVKAIKTLFPGFGMEIGETYLASDTEDELRRRNKISSGDRFDRYFNLSIEDIKISKGKLLNTIHNYSKEQLIGFFKELLKENRLEIYFREFHPYIVDLPFERSKIFIESFIELQLIDYTRFNQNKYINLNKENGFKIILKLLDNQDKKLNYKFISEMINESNGKDIGVLCRIVETIENNFNLYKNSENIDFNMIEKNDLKDLKSCILYKLNECSKRINFLDDNEIIYIYRVWKLLDQEEMKCYIKKQVEFSQNVPKLLNLYAGTWSNSKDNGWQFTNLKYEQYISTQEAYQKILLLKNTKEFNLLKHKFKEITVAFYLWCNLKEDDPFEKKVYKKDVDRLITDWNIIND